MTLDDSFLICLTAALLALIGGHMGSVYTRATYCGVMGSKWLVDPLCAFLR